MAEKKSTSRSGRAKTAPLTEDEAPVNPVETPTLQAHYEPTGQIIQPGEPLHSTDPEEQASFEEERREAIRRSQLGENYTGPETAEEESKNS